MSTYGINHIMIDIFEQNPIIPRNIFTVEFKKFHLNINSQKSLLFDHTRRMYFFQMEKLKSRFNKDKVSREKMYIVPNNLTPLLGRT